MFLSVYVIQRYIQKNRKGKYLDKFFCTKYQKKFRASVKPVG